MCTSLEQIFDVEAQMVFLNFMRFLKMPPNDIEKLIQAPMMIRLHRRSDAGKLTKKSLSTLNAMYSWHDIQELTGIQLAFYDSLAYRTKGPHQIFREGYWIYLFFPPNQPDLFEEITCP